MGTVWHLYLGGAAPNALAARGAQPSTASTSRAPFTPALPAPERLDEFIARIPDIRPKNSAFWELIMTVCWAAAFGGNPGQPRGFDLPIDPDTGALNEAVWRRWLAHDPIRKLDVPACAAALRHMRLPYVDVGIYDAYQLQVGARLLHRKREALGIPHVYEEYPDGHRHTDYRYAHSLERLSKALQ